jgi:aspartyl-tRNA(Asn)/glutamyl-tRNA(Gln) amidotransferase subunit B
VLTASREIAAFYEDVVARLGGEPKLAPTGSWATFSALPQQGRPRDRAEPKVSRGAARRPAGAHRRQHHLRQDRQGSVRGDVGFEGDADAIIEAKGLRQITDTGAIEKAIDEVMAKNPGQLADYRSGKDKLFGFFVGQVMKATGGKANPAQLNELLKKKLAG